MHRSVLLKEVLEYLNPRPGDFVIDGTINGGGHAKEILRKVLPDGKLLGIDWDKGLIEKLNHESWVEVNRSSLVLASGNYADIPNILKRSKFPKADGLLLDLGFSSEQIEESRRGFSFDRDEPLLMTYSDEKIPVAQVIRELTEKELSEIIFRLSGEKYSRPIAKAIKAAGKKKRIISSLELAEVIRGAVPKSYERGRIDPATRTFQALRIYANSELENLESLLKNLKEIVKTGGRVVVISFHSLEDSLIKNYFSMMEKNGTAKILAKKPIAASESEIGENQRSRSAKLRALQIL